MMSVWQFFRARLKSKAFSQSKRRILWPPIACQHRLPERDPSGSVRDHHLEANARVGHASRNLWDLASVLGFFSAMWMES